MSANVLLQRQRQYFVNETLQGVYTAGAAS